MKVLPGLYYTENHEWLRVEGSKGYMGITDYAQDQLGDIVFVELPVLDDELGQGDVLGVVESVKAAADVYTPVEGKVIQINEELIDNPGLLNESPYEAWIAVLEISNPSQLEALMDDAAFEAYCLK